MTTETPTPTPLSRAGRTHELAERLHLMEAIGGMDITMEALRGVEGVNGTLSVLKLEREKLQDRLAQLPVYRPPEPGQGENVDSEHMERVRVARAGEDTRGER